VSEPYYSQGARSVCVSPSAFSFIHVFIYSVIVVQLTTDNDRSKRSEVEVE